ncbi:MAG: MFS transporter [Acidimicrobiales bacterium]
MTVGSARPLRGLINTVYLPVFASTVGLGMLIPVLPLYLTEEGLSLQMTSVVLAGLGIGAALGGLPAGGLVAKYGERVVMIGALILLAVSTALLGVTTTALALLALRLASGAAGVALRLSRQTYITRGVPVYVRGRAMAVFGGSFRLSLLFGPLLGGLLVDQVGFAATFVVAGLFALVGLIPALLRPETPSPEQSPQAEPPEGLFTSLRRHWRSLTVAGVVPMLVMTVREGRFVVVPLIGDELGLSATEVGALVAVGTGAELGLFPLAGWIMDRYGRLHAMVPAFGLIGVGLTIIGLADSTAAVVLGGAVVGVGNGLSSGTMLTLGSDLAPEESPGPFLAGMAVFQDAGRVIGPLLVGVVGSALDLSAAALSLAIVCAVVIAWLVLVIGDTSPTSSSGKLVRG